MISAYFDRCTGPLARISSARACSCSLSSEMPPVISRPWTSPCLAARRISTLGSPWPSAQRTVGFTGSSNVIGVPLVLGVWSPRVCRNPGQAATGRSSRRGSGVGVALVPMKLLGSDRRITLCHAEATWLTSEPVVYSRP